MSVNTDKKLEIWVIDDDQSMRWVLQKTLGNNGYLVNAFESASVALTRFKRTALQERPALILTDVRMPGINGFELLKQIKHIAADVPVIIMTAYGDLDSTLRGFEEGAFEYLPKPFDIDYALELVARACSPKQGERQGQEAETTAQPAGDWQTELRFWATQKIARGDKNILAEASRIFEKTLLDCALQATHGRKQEAARLLGWGRNTLTRKLKELGQ